MICQRCGHNEATIHVTDVIQKSRRSLHLCEECARAQNLLAAPGAPQQLNLQALVQLIMGQPAAAETAALECPGCGQTYGAFRSVGRLGCPDDYDHFAAPLEPLLFRLHRGTRHEGKTPRHKSARAELERLRDELGRAVAAEDYAAAGSLRDLIRHKESHG